MTHSPTPSTLSLLSRILELEFGEARLQHYGLFTDSNVQEPDAGRTDSDLLLSAQRRFAKELEELVAKLDPNQSILVIGDTLLSLARSLAETGHSIVWFGSKSLLVEGLDTPPAFHYGGEDFVASAKPTCVDVLIIAGSIRYLDQLAILSKSRDVLGEAGRLILFGEFLQDDSRIEYSALPNLSSFEQLSRRLGFKQLENRDLSASAARTLELVAPLLVKHGATLAGEAASGPILLRDLQSDLATMCEEFSSGRRGFHLCVLRRELDTASEWANADFGDIHSFQPHEVAELFEKSFNVRFDADLWDWKYSQGDGKCVVARLNKQGEIVAHYGGAPRKIVYFGEAAMAIQPCDVMVHPSIRKQYGKGSLFFEVAATFLEREIGNTVNHLLGFGFPNQKTMNISKRLGLYEKTDDFIELAFPVAQGDSVRNEYTVVDYDPADAAARDDLDGLWAEMKKDFESGIIGVRDAAYIQHRYLNHPFARTQQYRCVILREGSSGPALAFAVIKQQEGGRLLMDLICPVAAMKDTISIIKQDVRKSDKDAILRLWVTRSGKENVCTDDAIVNELGIEIPCNSWNPGPDAERLYGAWWLTAGDMDFI